MDITFINQSENIEFNQFEDEILTLLNRSLEILGIEKKMIMSVVVVDDETIRNYNKEFRDIDASTDVLSFVDGSEFDDEISLGDIIVSSETCIRQADEYNHSLRREFLFLVTHGILHLLGYDHHTEEEEKEMIRLQKEILSGIAERSS